MRKQEVNKSNKLIATFMGLPADEKTTVCICGMNFYITWKNEKEGYDQRGTKWIDKSNPQCTDERVVNIALDTYNKIMALNKK